MATNVSTINHSGEDYATIALWESATDTNLVSSGDIEVLEVYKDDGALSQGSITIAGATTDASNYRVIRAKSGDEWGGDLDSTASTAATISVTADWAFNVTEDHFRFEDIRFVGSGNYYPIDGEADDMLIARCLFDGRSQLIQGIAMDTSPATTGGKIIRCVAIDVNYGFLFYNGDWELYNNTALNCDYGIASYNAATCKAINNIALDCVTADFYSGGASFWATGSGYNIGGGNTGTVPPNHLNSRSSTESTSPGTGDWVMFVDITANTEDLSLQDHAENDAVGYGETLTALESTDAYGNSANTDWDVGAFNLAAASTEYTKTATVNGYLESQDKTKTASVNGLLEDQDITETASVNAYLESQDITLTASAEGIVVTHKTLNVSHNALLKNLDVTLTATASGWLDLGATTYTVTAVGDAHLKAFNLTKAASAEGILYDPATVVYVATGRHALNTSTGNQSLTTANFGNATPKAAIQISSFATTNDSEAAHGQLSIGFTDGTTDRCISLSSEDAQGTTDTVRGFTPNFLRINIPGNLSPDVVADFNAWVTDGVQVNITNAPSAAYLTQTILFGGTNLQAHVSSVTTGQPNVAQDITTVGFEPDIVFFIDVDRNLDQELSDNFGAFGVAHNGDTVTQRCIGFEDNEGDSATATRGLYSDVYASSIPGDYQIEISDFDTQGFSITPRSAGARDVAYLALKLPDKLMSLTTLQTPPLTGDQEVDLDIDPNLLIAGMSMHASTNTLNTTGEAFPIGLWSADGSDEYSTTMRSEDGADPTDAACLSSDSIILTDDAGSTAFTGSLKSFDSDGFTLTWTAVSGTPRHWWLFALGDDVATSKTLGATANALLSYNDLTATSSANGLLKALDHTETSTADGVLFDEHTTSVSVSGHLIFGTALTASADAYLTESQQLTSTANGWLFQAAGTVLAQAEGVLVFNKQVTASVSGHIVTSLDVTVNAFIKETHTMTCFANGFILGPKGVWDTVEAPELPDWLLLRNER